MDKPFFYIAERFFLDENYEEFSKILGRAEIVTYDTMLCTVKSEHGLSEQIIAYYKNPTKSHEYHTLDDGFEFCGYDLSEESTMISAITNCGGMFGDAIPYEKLNKFGLIAEYSEAFAIRKLLDELYPQESHAECDVYELWRRL